MTTTTRTAVWQEILNRWDWLGFYATADTIGADYIEDVSEFAHERYGPNEVSERYAWRYNRSGDDLVRETLTLDTTLGRLSVDGNSSYGTTSDKDYAIVGLDPDVIIAAIKRGQTKQVDRTIRALGTFIDSDMEVSGVDYWDGTSGGSSKSNCTVEKSPTDAFSGSQALVITATGASAYDRSQRLRVPSGGSGASAKKGKFGVILRADVGTVTLKVYDYTNSAYLTVETRTYSGEDFAYVELNFTPLATTEEVQIEFALTGASDVIVVDAVFGPWFTGRRTFNLPSDLDEQYSVKFVRVSSFESQLKAGVYDAYSRVYLGDYDPKLDFQVEAFPRNANPSRINFGQHISAQEIARPMWIVAERPVSDVEPLDSESATTTQPKEQVVAYAMAEIAEVLRDRNKDDSFFQQLFNETRIEASIERLSRPPTVKVEEHYRRKLRA